MSVFVMEKELNRYKILTTKEFNDVSSRLFIVKYSANDNGEAFFVVSDAKMINKKWFTTDNKMMKKFANALHIDISSHIVPSDEKFILSLVNKYQQKNI